jgi:hypothetical protein
MTTIALFGRFSSMVMSTLPWLDPDPTTLRPTADTSMGRADPDTGTGRGRNHLTPPL